MRKVQWESLFLSFHPTARDCWTWKEHFHLSVIRLHRIRRKKRDFTGKKKRKRERKKDEGGKKINFHLINRFQKKKEGKNEGSKRKRSGKVKPERKKRKEISNNNKSNNLEEIFFLLFFLLSLADFLSPKRLSGVCFDSSHTFTFRISFFLLFFSFFSGIYVNIFFMYLTLSPSSHEVLLKCLLLQFLRGKKELFSNVTLALQ